jgi:uncharacterized tellurite resistance protein B-like protein
MPIRRLLALFTPEESPDDANPFAAALAPHLQRFSADQLEYFAGFAGQLTRVAYADDDVSEAEIETISRLLVDHAGLVAEEARVVIDLLKLQLEALRGFEEFRLNRAINEHASREERERLIDFLFAVAAADDLVSNDEDQEIRRIAYALEISNPRLMEIRGRYRDQLEILQHASAQRRSTQTPDG